MAISKISVKRSWLEERLLNGNISVSAFLLKICKFHLKTLVFGFTQSDVVMNMKSIGNRERILNYAKVWIAANSKDWHRAQICLALIEEYYSDKYGNKRIGQESDKKPKHNNPKILWEESSDELDWFQDLFDQEDE